MQKVLINDSLCDMKDAQVPITDRGYQFGDGVYEVIRFYNGVFFKLDEHLVRFKRSVEKIDVPFKYEMNKLKKLLQKMVDESGYNSGYVYAQITRGVGKRDHIYVGKKFEPQLVAYVVQEEGRPLEVMNKGAKVLLLEDKRWLHCDIKSLNLLGSVLAKNEAAKRGAKEAVLFRNGVVTEGSATNVFVVKNNVLYTHPANNLILNGITRLVVIEIAKKLGIQVEESSFIVEFFKGADEAFTTASVSEITPIISYEQDIKGKTIAGVIGSVVPGEITKRIQSAYNDMIQ